MRQPYVRILEGIYLLQHCYNEPTEQTTNLLPIHDVVVIVIQTTNKQRNYSKIDSKEIKATCPTRRNGHWKERVGWKMLEVCMH